jgi:peptidoglycan/LPS O-acetylase OafA/YrhL
METTAKHERYHALDSLRAAMMLLGVYIHAIAPFSTIPDVWWFRDSAAGAAFDLQLLAIHAFRMPVFFAMAGFFGALLLSRQGWMPFALNRAKRVLFPLLACLVLFIPLLRGLMLVQRLLTNTGTVRIQDFLAWYPRVLSDFNTGPYWFLLYLVYFYLLAILLRPMGRWISTGKLGSRLSQAFGKLPGRFWAPSFLALSSIPGLLMARGGVFPAPQGFLPDPRIMVVYAPFVLFGWALFHHRQGLSEFCGTAWGHLGMGLFWMILAVGACSLQLRVPAWESRAFVATVWTGSLCVWEMLFALLGLFQRYLAVSSPRLRYISDSSYWVYLAHSPVLLFLQLFLFRTAWPGSLKLLLTLSLAVPMLFASYHWLVRPTWLGAWLNGRRYQRRELQPQQATHAEGAKLPVAAAVHLYLGGAIMDAQHD